MASGDILSDFGINLLEEEIDDVIFQTNEFLTDATFTGSQGPFWWILQMCMALAALFAIIMAAYSHGVDPKLDFSDMPGICATYERGQNRRLRMPGLN